MEKLQEVYGLPIPHVLYGSKEEQQKLIIKESEPSYDKKLFDNVREILESGNVDVIKALKANIKAFLGAARATKEKRKYHRFLLSLPVDFQIMDDSEARSGMILNASQMGFLIQSAHDMPVGEKMNLEISLPKNAGSEGFRAKAEIMWKDKRRLNDAEQFHYGVKLIEVLNEGHAKLESLLRG